MKPFFLLLVALGVGGCPWVRERALSAAPNLPPPSGCEPRTQRCHEGVPEVCSSSTRWITALPASPDGTPRRCAHGCGFSRFDASLVAHCVEVSEAGVAPDAVPDALLSADSDADTQDGTP